MIEKALILYASTNGHTAKVAARMAAIMREAALDVTVREAWHDEIEPAGFSGVIVAASVHRGEHQREVIEWVGRHRAALATMPNMFVSVSLTAAEETEAARAEAQAFIDRFQMQTGWLPAETVAMAGALQYREHDSFTRLLMRLLMRHEGHPNDTSRDYDFTDWSQVEGHARRFSQRLVSASTTSIAAG